jgi:hypothetical protein
MTISLHPENLSFYAWQLIVGFSVLLVYAALVVWSRSVYIARANRVWTDAHGDALTGRRKGPGAPGSDACQDANESIEPLLDQFGEREPAAKFRWQFTWNGAQEIGDWVRLHEAQRQIVWCWKPASVIARFERAVGQLDELPADRQVFWQARWQELRTTCPWGRDLTDQEISWYKANLIELLAELYNARDAKYSQLASLYGKAAWLVLAAFLPLAALLTLGYGVILLAGAIGGLISRLQQLVYAKGLPTAYGSSWVPLYLAPLLGALAAWAGLTLLALLQTLQVIDLPALNVSAGYAGLPSTQLLGIAVLLGLSERFLNRIGAQAEEVVGTPASQPSTDASAAGTLKTAQIAATAATAAAHPNGHQPPAGDRPTGTTAQPQSTVPVEQPALPEGSVRRSYTAKLDLQGWNSRRANRPTAGVARTNGESPY